jgi:hypothetical protein
MCGATRIASNTAPRGFAAANGHDGRTDDEIRAVMGDKFPKHIYHSIICSSSLRMADDDLRDQILRLEAHIDELTEVIESCRKAILVSRVVIAAGAMWLLAFTFGAIRFDSMAMIGALAAVIGATVVFGSNTSTSKQAAADIKAAEELRAELIDKINLRLVGEAE